MKKLLCALSVITLPLLGNCKSAEANWAELFEEQVSNMHDMIWTYYEEGDIKHANQCIFMLFCLINNEPPQNVAERFGLIP